MPIYEYVCEQCGECTEMIQRLADPPLQECLKCGGKLRKKVSAPAFQFKGTGWYVTDYARKGESGKSSESSESGKSSGSSESSSSGGADSSAGPVKKAEPKTESKTESKSEPKPATANKSSKD
ncbi:MAG TPA: FmdB family zinc ribbon protein [Thermoanaerobaculia bacterium]|nr:FmdB family zinc ribbon protein [Thermoanaerobaculia bacterium]